MNNCNSPLCQIVQTAGRDCCFNKNYLCITRYVSVCMCVCVCVFITSLPHLIEKSVSLHNTAVREEQKLNYTLKVSSTLLKTLKNFQICHYVKIFQHPFVCQWILKAERYLMEIFVKEQRFLFYWKLCSLRKLYMLELLLYFNRYL